MMMNSSKMLFSTTMILGIITTTSSNNWIMMWCGLEISMISFIPLMINKKSISSESTIKYFIVQSVSSSILMLGLVFMIMKGDYNYEYMLMTALLVKTGVAPFHNWVLTVLSGLSYNMCLIMISINKVAPLLMMSFLTTSISMIIMITMIVGAVLGINQNSFKKIIGYSSIYNMGLILTIIKSNIMWILYMTVYSIMLFLMIYIIKINYIDFINQMVMMETINNKMSMWMNLLSMGGMPPFMGFFIKYIVLYEMINMKSMMLSMLITLIISSLLVMMFYMRITFLAVMNNLMYCKNKMYNIYETSLWVIVINISMLPILFMIK
nr:NADH dehydrogenase subunit 2 [Zorka maculata]